jgi:hypothetical protein
MGPWGGEIDAGAAGEDGAVVLVAACGQIGAQPPSREQVGWTMAQAALARAAGGAVALVTSATVWGVREAGGIIEDADPAVAAPHEGTAYRYRLYETAWRNAAERLDDAGPAGPWAVLRPAALVGDGIDTFVTRHFAAPRLLEVRPGAMVWQFAHVDDVAAAVRHVLATGIGGVMGVASTGAMTQADLGKTLGRRPLRISEHAATGAAGALTRAGVLRDSPVDLPFVLHPWVVGGDTLRASGWVPTHTEATCAQALAAQVGDGGSALVRGLGAHEALTAGAGAAGAAVAILGSAALVRRARSRRGRGTIAR